MITVTIEIPDDKRSILSGLTEFAKNAGLNISIDRADDNLSDSAFKSLQDACNEAVLIKKGLSKAILPSELWND